MEFPFRAFFHASGPETHIGELSGVEKTREYGKKKQALEIVGAKEGTRTPTGVTPQDPESCASTKFRHFRTCTKRSISFAVGLSELQLTTYGSEETDGRPAERWVAVPVAKEAKDAK